MQFEKQFHGGRLPFVLTGHGEEANRYSTEISAIRRAARHPSTEIRISFRAGPPV